MSTTDPKNATADADAIRAAWLAQLSGLIDTVSGWASELGWSLRRIEKPMEDSQVGDYRAPALLLQEGTVRILLDPIGHSAPGAEGVVDLYLMPAYDDIATLLYYKGGWHLHYSPRRSGAAAVEEPEAKPLSKETFAETLDQLRQNAA
jgi:hypothetical protein